MYVSQYTISTFPSKNNSFSIFFSLWIPAAVLQWLTDVSLLRYSLQFQRAITRIYNARKERHRIPFFPCVSSRFFFQVYLFSENVAIVMLIIMCCRVSVMYARNFSSCTLKNLPCVSAPYYGSMIDTRMLLSLLFLSLFFFNSWRGFRVKATGASGSPLWKFRDAVKWSRFSLVALCFRGPLDATATIIATSDIVVVQVQIAS